MVYYRKYRPQTIAELDSAKLRETLYSVLQGINEDGQDAPRKTDKRSQPSASVPHAFLLTGPKGLGKTSTARIIAKVVNCEKRKPGSIEPCNTCEQCVSITKGSNIDVLEIDGASNRGIDEIRDLRDKVKLAPSRAKKKVYIIDEVHMLTTEAFNALLKTIEEPPSHVMFLFATTEAHKVPETIVSRCFHVTFPKATEEDIVHSLERVVKGEKLAVEKGVLQEIAKLADGGFRDATKILEELVLVAGDKKIDRGFIENYFKTTDIPVAIANLLGDLYRYDVKMALRDLQNVIQQGTDIKWFITQVLSRLNDILLAQLGVVGDISQYPENNCFSIEEMKTLVGLFSEAYQETKYAVIPQLPLELVVVAWCSANNSSVILNDSEGSSKDSSAKPQNSNVYVESTNKQTINSLLKKEKNLKVQAILRGQPTTPDKKNSNESVSDTEQKVQQEEITNKADAERLMDNLIFKVKPQNHSVAGVLRGCVVKSIGNGKIVFETSFKFHKERLDEMKTKEILETALKEITGKNLTVMVELISKDKI